MTVGLSLGADRWRLIRRGDPIPQWFADSGTPGLYYDVGEEVYEDAAGTVPTSVGGLIGHVPDKSANGHAAAQGIVASKPILAQGVGGQRRADCDGVDDYLDVENPGGVRFDRAVSVFVTARSNGAGSRDLVRCGLFDDLLYGISAQANGAWAVTHNDGVKFKSLVTPDGVWPAGSMAVLGFVRSADGLQYELRHNGVTILSQPITTPPQPAAAQVARIGGSVSTRSFSGGFSSVVIAGAALTTGEYQMIEQALAKKAGVVLP